MATSRAGFKGILGLSVALVAGALLGPRAHVGEAPGAVDLPEDLEAYLSGSEGAVPELRPGDHKEIVWARGEHGRTALSVVYLHGFSADRHEIDPVPRLVAEALDANLYYARLAGHGQDGAAMGRAQASDWLRDVEEALAVGGRIGDRVVVLGTSTGGTLAVWGASRSTRREVVHALVLMSPNFQPRSRASRVLLWPWGGALARLLVGPERCFEPANPEQARHWTTCYPVGALLPMMALVEEVRALDFGAIQNPVLMLHSEDDRVVDVRETRRVFVELGSTLKRMEAVEGVDDRDGHILAGRIMSPRSTDDVAARIVAFVRETLAATPSS